MQAVVFDSRTQQIYRFTIFTSSAHSHSQCNNAILHLRAVTLKIFDCLNSDLFCFNAIIIFYDCRKKYNPRSSANTKSRWKQTRKSGIVYSVKGSVSVSSWFYSPFTLPGEIIANLSPNKTWKCSLGSVLSAKASEIRTRAVCCSGSGQQELALHCLAAQETVMSAILGWTAERVVCRHFFFPSLFHF